MRKKWSIRYTGRPFGPCERLDDSDYIHEYSKHSTLLAAQKAIDRLNQQETAAWGQNAWGDHNAIFALEDIPMVARFRCDGCGNETEHRYTWLRNTSRPRLPDYCPTCEERLHKMKPGDADFDLWYDYETNDPYNRRFPFRAS